MKFPRKAGDDSSEDEGERAPVPMKRRMSNEDSEQFFIPPLQIVDENS